jgi:hypothetical protein
MTTGRLLYGLYGSTAASVACTEMCNAREIVYQGNARRVPNRQLLEQAQSVALELIARKPELKGKPYAYQLQAIKNAITDARQQESGGRIVRRNGRRVQAYHEEILSAANPEHAAVLALRLLREFERIMDEMIHTVDRTISRAEWLQRLNDTWLEWAAAQHGQQAAFVFEQIRRNGRSEHDVAEEMSVTRAEVQKALWLLDPVYRESFSPVLNNLCNDKVTA